MKELLKKYTKEEFITADECLEEYGEYLHMDLFGYSPKELREFAEQADCCKD